MLDDGGVDVVEEAADVFGCDVFGVVIGCCGFGICIGVELDVEDWLFVVSFGSVACICNERGLSSSSIGVAS